MRCVLIEPGKKSSALNWIRPTTNQSNAVSDSQVIVVNRTELHTLWKKYLKEK